MNNIIVDPRPIMFPWNLIIGFCIHMMESKKKKDEALRCISCEKSVQAREKQKL